MTDKKDKTLNGQTTRSDNIFREFINKTKHFKELITNKYNPFDSEHRSEPKDNDAIANDMLDRTKTQPKNTPYFKLSTHLWRPIVTSDEYLFYFQPGVQYKTIRKLRSGKIRAEATLDLHQKNKEQAAIELSNFIEEAYDNELRCVCIIHGKGNRSNQTHPILKNLINHWLHDINLILGFCSCPPNMGDTGAVLVLLKRHADN